VGVAAMLTPGLFAWAKFIDVPKDAACGGSHRPPVELQFPVPGEDGVLGTVDARFVTDTNPFGINPDDPHGRDDVLIATQELHIPVGKPIKMELRSIDVLHDFTVPQMRSKMNMAPGLVTYLWYTPVRAGTYDAFCEQLCGIAHYAMRATVVVEDDAAFQKVEGELPDVRADAGRSARRRDAGAPLYAVVRSLPWRAGRGQSHAQRAEACRSAGLVPEATARELQERIARRERQGYVRQDDGADGADVAGRRRGQQRRRLHQVAARHAASGHGQRQCERAVTVRTRTAPRVTARKARESRRRTRRASRG
jgi:cytochrome c oxidase subunit 2